MTIFGVNIFALVFLCALAFFMPTATTMLHKRGVGILGEELYPFALPAIAAFCFYKDEQEMGVGFAAMSVAYVLGLLWHRKRTANPP